MRRPRHGLWVPKSASLKPVKTVREMAIPYSPEERRVDKWVLMDESGVGQHIGWRKMGRQSAEMLFEALEARRLLSGVTLITHGYEPISSARPSWLDEMKNAIIEATGADTAVYALRVNSNSLGEPYVESFDWLAGDSAA